MYKMKIVMVAMMFKVEVDRFSFYDTETSGIDTQLDQILQWANVFTDADLNIDESTMSNVICRPRPDVVPHPKAFLTHNLDMDILNAEGVNEFVLARRIQSAFMASDNIGVSGYNTSKYDDEMVRNLFFRNMKGIYDHEWKDGNVTFDVMNLVHLVYALRPEILNWKIREDGMASFKLSDMAEANGIIHENAHDALSDVFATIGIAKKIKTGNPKIFEYALNMCSKKNGHSLMSTREPLLHISNNYGKKNNITTMIYPVIMDADNKNKYHCVDLRHDPRILLELSPEDIRKYLFTKRSDLPEDSPKIPISSIQVNKQPMIVGVGYLNDAVASASNLDKDQCLVHLEILRENKELGAKIRSAFMGQSREVKDPYRSIYIGGFFDNEDQRIRAIQHHKVGLDGDDTLTIEKSDIHEVAFKMKDYVRHFDLLLRCKWNSFYDKLLSSEDFSPTEFRKWVDYLEKKLYLGVDENDYTIPKFREEVASIDLEIPLDSNQMEILRKLSDHVNSLEIAVKYFREQADLLFMDAEDERSRNLKITALEARISTMMSFEQRKPIASDVTSLSM